MPHPIDNNKRASATVAAPQPAQKKQTTTPASPAAAPPAAATPALAPPAAAPPAAAPPAAAPPAATPPAATPPVAFHRKKRGRQAKSPNFCEQEDVALTKAWMNVSNDGADQTAEMFWERVKRKYDIILKDDVHEDLFITFTDRAATTLMHRFKQQIQKKCLAFNVYYKRVKNSPPSGTNEADWLEIAANDYKECESDSSFTFFQCHEILRSCPKFNHDCEEILDDDIDLQSGEDGKPAAASVIEHPMGSRLQRPMGSKRAKKKAADERSMDPRASPTSLSRLASSGPMQQMLDMQASMVENQAAMVASLNSKMAALQKFALHNILSSNYKNIYEIESRKGNMDAADAALKKMYEMIRLMEAEVSKPPDVFPELPAATDSDNDSDNDIGHI